MGPDRAADSRTPWTPLGIWSGIAFLAFVVGGLLHAVFALYLSGERVALLDLQQGRIVTLPGLTLSRTGPRLTRVGPLDLDPAMNPIRVVLHAGYHATGVNRIGYTVRMRDAADGEVWERHASLGGHDGNDGATTAVHTVVQSFRLDHRGTYWWDVRFDFFTLDGLERASLEVRRNVAPVNPVFLIGCLIGAIASLFANVLGRQGRRREVRVEVPAKGSEPRAA